MPTLQENVRYFRQQVRDSFSRTLTNINNYRHYCFEQAALFAVYTRRVAHQAVRACYEGAVLGYQLLRRFCLNLLDEIMHLPQHLYQAFILTSEALRMIGQVLANTIKPAARWVAGKVLLGSSHLLGFILGASAAVGDLIVDGARLLLGALPFGPRAAVAAGALAAGVIGARSVIATAKPSQLPQSASRPITPSYQKAKTLPPDAKNTPISNKKRLRKAA
ncbi:MAG: hypothetical protein AB7I18_06360 [Candidatus Berkiella sp.]